MSRSLKKGPYVNERLLKKVMAQMDKDMEKYKDMPMPFDMKRMAYAGFKVVVDA